jgi:hypothetical protein
VHGHRDGERPPQLLPVRARPPAAEEQPDRQVGGGHRQVRVAIPGQHVGVDRQRPGEVPSRAAAAAQHRGLRVDERGRARAGQPVRQRPPDLPVAPRPVQRPVRTTAIQQPAASPSHASDHSGRPQSQECPDQANGP